MSDFGSAPGAQAAREHRWRHIEHLLLTASVSLACRALQHLPFSGMTSSGCVWGRPTRRRYCWRRFRPVISSLLLPWPVLSRSCSNLQLPWAVRPLGCRPGELHPPYPWPGELRTGELPTLGADTICKCKLEYPLAGFYMWRTELGVGGARSSDSQVYISVLAHNQH